MFFKSFVKDFFEEDYFKKGKVLKMPLAIYLIYFFFLGGLFNSLLNEPSLFGYLSFAMFLIIFVIAENAKFPIVEKQTTLKERFNKEVNE